MRILRGGFYMLNFENFDYNAVLRYLNLSQSVLCDLQTTIDEVLSEVKLIATPKTSYRLYDMAVDKKKCLIEEINLSIKSETLSKCFDGCDKVLIMAVTIGADIDNKIKNYFNIDKSKAMIFDAVASVYVENLIDELEAQLHHIFYEKHFSMRFSAGYGDVPLGLQKPILDAVEGFERLGITLDDKFFMSPMKSITALIGLSDFKTSVIDICDVCKFDGKCKTRCSRATKKVE